MRNVKSVLGAMLWGWVVATMCVPAMAGAPEYTVTVETPLNAVEGKYWMQVRGGAIPQPGDTPSLAVVIMQLTDSVGTHMYHGLTSFRTFDLGKTWSAPVAHETLERIHHDNGLIEVPVDATLTYHPNSGKLLMTGATFWLDPKLKKDVPKGPSDTAYAVYDPEQDTWTRWAKLKMPEGPKFRYARAGSTQPVVEPNGDILLPIYFGEHNNSIHYFTVVRCRFEGDTLIYVEHGDELKVDFGRGFSEPSMVHYKGRYYMTLRNDKRGYVTVSDDGLHFPVPAAWEFTDGEPLGNYNTQQHWVAHSEGLFLAYNRRGLDNDDVFRHRAPLVMAVVDTETLKVDRKTEQVLLPKVGKSTFGNFGVAHVSANETWVTAGRGGANAGEPSVYVARIHWAKPNARMVAE